MTNELSRKDENCPATVAERTKPTLVTIGNKQVISSGRWNDDLMVQYVLENARSKWLTVGDLARTAYGQNTPKSKERVRRCLSRLFHALRDRQEFLAIEYDSPRNRAISVKVADLTSALDVQNVIRKLERMRKRRELTSGQYEQAILLLQMKGVCQPGEAA